MKSTELSRSIRLALAGIVLLGTVAAPPAAWALGFGQARVQSGVGEILVADIELLAESAELSTLKLSLASAAEYQIEGISFNPALSGARVSLKKSDDGKSFAQIVTKSGIRESYVQVILEAQTSSGKVHRTYSLSIDSGKSVSGRVLSVPAASAVGDAQLVVVQSAVFSAAPASTPLLPSRQAAQSAQAAQLVDASSSGNLTNIIQVGTTPRILSLVKSGGQDKPIQAALAMIVPKGWKGYATDPAVKFSGTASWQAKRNWLVELDSVLSTAQLMATVDFDKKEVIFSSIKLQSKDTSSGAPAGRPGVATANTGIATPTTVARVALATPEVFAVPVIVNTAIASSEADAARGREMAAASSNAEAANKAAQESQAELEKSKINLAEMQAQLNTATADSAHYRAQARGIEAALHRSEDRVNGLTEKAQKAQQTGVQIATAELNAEQKAKEILEKAKLENALNDAQAQKKQTSEVQASLMAQSDKLTSAQALSDAQNEKINELNRSLALTQDRLSKAMSGKLPPVPSAAPVQVSRSLSVSGPALTDQSGVRSSGMNVSFSNAIKQIVPAGWMVTSDPSVANTAVSWNGNSRPWTQVLEDLLTGIKLKASIDTAGREIRIGR